MVKESRQGDGVQWGNIQATGDHRTVVHRVADHGCSLVVVPPLALAAADHMTAEEVRSAVAAAPVGNPGPVGKGHERR